MMLRSAEADPHVIEHKAGTGAEAPASPREIAPQVPVPEHRRRDGNRTPAGAGIAPDGRSRARPAARRRPPGFHGRSRGASFALRPHPPRWADDRARRNLTKQPTSRLCSADESVVTSRRCQRPVTRSFHGLCVPLQGPAHSVPARRCRTGRRSSTEPKLGGRVPRPCSVAASRRGIGSLESLWRFTPLTRRSAVGETGGTRLAEASSAATPFQRRGGSPPCRAPDAARGRSRAW